MKSPCPIDEDAPIAVLMARIEELIAQNATLTAEKVRLVARVAALDAKLELPPKTPDNSNLPPSSTKTRNARGLQRL